MKKFIIIVIMALGIGFVFGKMMFSQYEKKVENVFNSSTKIYVLQQGVYSSEENVKKYTSKVNYYITVKDEQYYRVYVAMTNNQNNVAKLKEIFVNDGNNIYVRELDIDNIAFSEVLDQYEKLLDATSKKEEILVIEKQVLSKYKELVIGND